MKNSKTNVFIDTDMGWDDWCAITLLAQSEYINIVGINVNGVGEAHLTNAKQNAANIMALNGIYTNEVMLGVGTSVPSSFSNVFPADFRQQMDNLMGFNDMPKVDIQGPLMNANESLEKALNDYEDLTLLAIGGFTNLHNYLTYVEEQKIHKDIKIPKTVVAMAGVINNDDNKPMGNINSLFPQAYPNNNTAEWNIFIDPKAAKSVIDKYKSLDSDYSLTLSTLNASYQVQLEQSFIDEIKAGCGTNPSILQEFIIHTLQDRLNSAGKGGYNEYFYDPLAAAGITDKEIINKGSGWGPCKGDFDVVTELDEGHSTLGKLTYTPNEQSNISYVEYVDDGLFKIIFSKAITNITP
ncbi:MAG: nucleoside hydrolase [Gammaproteobacteria bacterium]|jgi:inosine-uridine nucleoside N-ribohydrolase|nr:nucleoside hydrolase [Gammaproteobacteria bacterium]